MIKRAKRSGGAHHAHVTAEEMRSYLNNKLGSEQSSSVRARTNGCPKCRQIWVDTTYNLEKPGAKGLPW